MIRYLHNMLIASDQWLNALAFGDPDETISSRLGKAAARGNPAAHFLCHLIGFFLGSLHCHDAIEIDEGSEAVVL